MSTSPIRELDIWSEVLGPDENGMPKDDAKAILRWSFNEQAKARMEELATRNNQGAISDSERSELEAYIHVGQVVGILQARARRALQRDASNGSS